MEGLGAEENDLATTLAGPHMVVEFVGHCIRWEGDVAGGKNVDHLAAAAFREVDCSGALSVQRGLGSDQQTECGGERTANAGGCICGGDVLEKLNVVPCEEQLSECDFDVCNLEICRELSCNQRPRPGRREREPGLTLIRRTMGPESFSALAKRIASIVVHISVIESRYSKTCVSISSRTVAIWSSNAGLASFGKRGDDRKGRRPHSEINTQVEKLLGNTNVNHWKKRGARR